jgi:hypothetical protein
MKALVGVVESRLQSRSCFPPQSAAPRIVEGIDSGESSDTPIAGPPCGHSGRRVTGSAARIGRSRGSRLMEGESRKATQSGVTLRGISTAFRSERTCAGFYEDAA